MGYKWFDGRREEARRLRAKEGLSVKQIAKRLKASQGSVSIWVRDVELTDEQKYTLHLNRGIKAADRRSETYRQRRMVYQQEGRERAREKDSLHLAGCMLYWAEGSKGKNTLGFSNADPNMIKFFWGFLRECFGVTADQLDVRLAYYTDNGITAEEIHQYWLALLNIPTHCLGKPVADNLPVSSQRKQGKRKTLPFGTCTLRVNNTRILQQIFGAIQEYTGLDNDEWIGV